MQTESASLAMTSVLAFLKRQFEYNAWANKTALGSLKRVVPDDHRCARIFAHVLAVEDLWLVRMSDEVRDVVVWPSTSVAEARDVLERTGKHWDEFFAGLSDDALTRRVSYVNSVGESWTNTVGDILQQVVLHSAYHRGQIAATLSEHKHNTPYTDFIHAVRQGFVT